MISDAEPFALTGVVIAEILQGLRRDADEIERYLSQWDMLEPQGFPTYSHAAAIFRHARSKGIALTTIDSLIAAVALEHGATLFALDRDFSRIARFAPLRLYPLSRH
jgi:predicted nucleic acid-binding protein